MLISVDIHSYFKLKYLGSVDGSEVRALADYLSSNPAFTQDGSQLSANPAPGDPTPSSGL